VLADLEGEGYTCRTFIIPAVAVDAKHRRDRVWIVGHSESSRRDAPQSTGSTKDQGPERAFRESSSHVADSSSTGRKEQHPATEPERPGHSAWSPDPGRPDWPAEPGVGRVVNGIPHRVDRIKALGNAIVPQVAYQIFKAINAIQGN
jgi:DNA (cytosine-5)-methyltransferase 1